MTRPQFSLRTLLIVVAILAVPCWYVGAQYRIVRARERLLEEHPGEIFPFDASSDRPAIPWIRTMFGDMPHRQIIFWKLKSDEVMEHIQELFPEAELYRMETTGSITTFQYWPPPKKLIPTR